MSARESEIRDLKRRGWVRYATARALNTRRFSVPLTVSPATTTTKRARAESSKHEAEAALSSVFRLIVTEGFEIGQSGVYRRSDSRCREWYEVGGREVGPSVIRIFVVSNH